MSKSDVSDRDLRTLAAFRYELRSFLHFSERAARAVGLTPQQHQALLTVRAHPDGVMLIGEIAERLLLRPHSVTELVNRMEKLDLVVRSPADDDRRHTQVRLTARSIALLADLSTSHRDELRRLRPLLQNIVEQL